MRKLANIFWRIVFWNNPVGYVRKMGAKIGRGSLFMDHPKLGSEPYLITIGEQTLISFGCSFVTHDGGRWVLDRLYPESVPFARFGRIVIGNNCFIGCRCTLLPDVCIGDNCVIGAGSGDEECALRRGVGRRSGPFYLQDRRLSGQDARQKTRHRLEGVLAKQGKGVVEGIGKLDLFRLFFTLRNERTV